MAVINDQEVRRTHASAPRTGSTIRIGVRGPRHPRVRATVPQTVRATLPQAAPQAVRQTKGRTYPHTYVCAAAADPAAWPGVTRLHPRPAAVESAVESEQLPLAVGLGSTTDLAPSRLWAVPGLPGDFVTLPALLDDGGQRWRDDDCPVDVGHAEGRPDYGWRGSARRGARFTVYSGNASRSRRPGSAIVREPAPLHLTARGRAVLLLLAAVVGVVVVVFAWFGAGSSAAPVRAAQPARVTVHEGDTLWSIAGKVAPNRDPRAVVARLLQLNHLRTPSLVPGQVLLTR